MTLYTSPDGAALDVYQILSVEERDHFTVSLMIDCPLRFNKHIISRDAAIAWKPRAKDLVAFYQDGRIAIVKPGERSTLGVPATDSKPLLDTPMPPATGSSETKDIVDDTLPKAALIPFVQMITEETTEPEEPKLNVTSGVSSMDGSPTVMSKSQFGQVKFSPPLDDSSIE